MIIEYGTDVPGIAIVRSTRPWARTLHRYVVDHGGAVVRTRPLEERQALEDEYDVLIVDDVSSFLSAHIVEELHRLGRTVLGVFDPKEYAGDVEANVGRQRLLRLGVDRVIESQANPEEFIRAIEDLAPARQRRTAPAFDDAFGTTSSLNDDVGALTGGHFDQTAAPAQAPSSGGGELVRTALPDTRRRGHVTAVFGASGGSGVTEVAIELARQLGRRGERTVLVDGDELAPSMAQRLNLQLHPNLRTAVDVVEHSTGRIAETLAAIANGLEVLVGLPHPKDWVELRSTDMQAVIGELSRGHAHVVLNGSPMIEDLTMQGGVDRFGISRAVVANADTIVVVASPTPMGVARLLDRIADLHEIAEGKQFHVVVNRTQKGAFKRKEIANEIKRTFNPAGLHFLPADPNVERAAWEGTLVRSGDFTNAIGESLLNTIPRVHTPSRSGSRSARPAAARKGA